MIEEEEDDNSEPQKKKEWKGYKKNNKPQEKFFKPQKKGPTGGQFINKDVPREVLGMRKTDSDDIEVLIAWKLRANSGYVPLNTIVDFDVALRECPELICTFFESKMKAV